MHGYQNRFFLRNSKVMIILGWALMLGGPSVAPGQSGQDGSKSNASSLNEPKPSGTTAGSGVEPVHVMKEVVVIGQGEMPLFVVPSPRDVLARPLTESPGLETATTIVGKEEIEWLNAYTIVDAMKYVPGAWTESRGRKEKQLFSLRGQRYPYPGYLMDGAWFREFTEATYFLNAACVERLEITRSISDLLLTPGGMAGNINIVPRAYTRPETEVRTEYGSFNTLLEQVSHGDALGKGAYGLGLGYHHTDGPEGKNAAENVVDVYGRVLYPVTPRLQLSLMGYFMDGNRQLKVAEPPASPANQARVERFDPMRYYFLVGKARFEADDWAATELTVNYGDRRFEGHRVGTADWVEKDYELGGRLIESLTLFEENHLRFGGLYNHWETPTGKRFYVGNPGNLDTYAGTITDEQQFGRLTADVGYRFSRTYYREFGGFNVEGEQSAALKTVKVRDEWDDPLHTVNAGLKYQLSEPFALLANVAWGQIASQPGMLTAALTRPGTETRFQYDVGVKWDWHPLGQLCLTGFFVDQQNAPLATSAKRTVNGVDFVLFENTDAESYGVELDLRSKRFDSGFQFFLNSVLMTTRRVEKGLWKTELEVPEVILGGGVSYLYRRLEVDLLAKHLGGYENNRFLAAGAPPAALGDFTELSATLNFYFGKAWQHRVFFTVDNFTDDRYSTVPGYPDEGRQFRGGLRLKF